MTCEAVATLNLTTAAKAKRAHVRVRHSLDLPRYLSLSITYCSGANLE